MSATASSVNETLQSAVANDNVTSSLMALINHVGFDNSDLDMRAADRRERDHSVLAAAQMFLASAASRR